MTDTDLMPSGANPEQTALDPLRGPEVGHWLMVGGRSTMPIMMKEIASDAVIDQAYEWLCKQRRRYAHNNDVWDVRLRWDELKPQLQADLLAGEYRFSPVQRYQSRGESLEVGSAMDALVLKAMQIVLSDRLDLPKSCTHLKGHGGAKAAVRHVVENLKDRPFVFRSDVKQYYASIDHEILMDQLRDKIQDKIVLNLIWQYLGHTAYQDGIYRQIKRGICLGCALSPIMGAVYLESLDRRMEKSGLFYVRFMDDWVVLAKTRWHLRRAIHVIRQALDALKVDIHPDKTFVGRVSRGFTFLGYKIASEGIVDIAPQTREKFLVRLSSLIRLYEQGACELGIGDVLKRFYQWSYSGLTQVPRARVQIPASLHAFYGSPRKPPLSQVRLG